MEALLCLGYHSGIIDKEVSKKDMSEEFRYVIHRTGSGITKLIDTLKANYIFVGIKHIEAMGLTRSDLVELKEQVDKMLEKP